MSDSKHLKAHILAFTAVRTVFNTIYRMAYPFIGVLARGVGVDISAMAMAITGRSLMGALGPFLSTIADRHGRKTGMLSGVGLYVAGLLLVVWIPTYPALFAALVVTTLGKYLFDPSMQAYIGDQIHYRQRGLAIAVTEIGWSLSFLLGVPLAGFLIARGGWLTPFQVFAVFGILAFVGLRALLPADPHDTPAAPPFWENMNGVWKSTPALFGLSIGLLASAANEVVNLMFGVWLEDQFGLQLLALSGASAVIGFSELGGELLVGKWTDRLGKRRAIALGLLSNCAAAVLLPIIGQSVNGALIGLFLFYITFEFTLVSSIPMMTEILPKARATLMALNVAALSLGRALGAWLGPLFYQGGLVHSAWGAVFLNLLALLALWGLHKPSNSQHQPSNI